MGLPGHCAGDTVCVNVYVCVSVCVCVCVCVCMRMSLHVCAYNVKGKRIFIKHRSAPNVTQKLITQNNRVVKGTCKIKAAIKTLLIM